MLRPRLPYAPFCYSAGLPYKQDPRVPFGSWFLGQHVSTPARFLRARMRLLLFYSRCLWPYSFKKIFLRHKNQSMIQQISTAPSEYTKEALATLNPAASRWA